MSRFFVKLFLPFTDIQIFVKLFLPFTDFHISVLILPITDFHISVVMYLGNHRYPHLCEDILNIYNKVNVVIYKIEILTKII